MKKNILINFTPYYVCKNCGDEIFEANAIYEATLDLSKNEIVYVLKKINCLCMNCEKEHDFEIDDDRFKNISKEIKYSILEKNKLLEHIQLIQTYTDDERILAQCNLILKEIEDENNED